MVTGRGSGFVAVIFAMKGKVMNVPVPILLLLFTLIAVAQLSDTASEQEIRKVLTPPLPKVVTSTPINVNSALESWGSGDPLHSVDRPPTQVPVPKSLPDRWFRCDYPNY